MGDRRRPRSGAESRFRRPVWLEAESWPRPFPGLSWADEGSQDSKLRRKRERVPNRVPSWANSTRGTPGNLTQPGRSPASRGQSAGLLIRRLMVRFLPGASTSFAAFTSRRSPAQGSRRRRCVGECTRVGIIHPWGRGHSRCCSPTWRDRPAPGRVWTGPPPTGAARGISSSCAPTSRNTAGAKSRTSVTGSWRSSRASARRWRARARCSGRSPRRGGAVSRCSGCASGSTPAT